MFHSAFYAKQLKPDQNSLLADLEHLQKSKHLANTVSDSYKFSTGQFVYRRVCLGFSKLHPIKSPLEGFQTSSSAVLFSIIINQGLLFLFSQQSYIIYQCHNVVSLYLFNLLLFSH